MTPAMWTAALRLGPLANRPAVAVPTLVKVGFGLPVGSVVGYVRSRKVSPLCHPSTPLLSIQGSPGAYIVRKGGEFPRPLLERELALRNMNPAEFQPEEKVTSAVRFSKIPSPLVSVGGWPS